MDAPTLQLFRSDDYVAHVLPERGVGWVLGWAATLAVLTLSALLLLAFAYQLAAEQMLARAAEVGLREAALPRATTASVNAVVRNRLANHFALDRATTVLLERNGSPLKGAVRLQTGDHLFISLSAPITAVLPRWLQALTWNNGQEIVWQMEQHCGLTKAVTLASSTRPAARFRL